MDEDVRNKELVAWNRDEWKGFYDDSEMSCGVNDDDDVDLWILTDLPALLSIAFFLITFLSDRIYSPFIISS